MKRTGIITLLLIAVLSINGQAQIIKTAKNLLKTENGKGFTEEEAATGIKEALSKGTVKGVEMVSKTDGYFGDTEIKIPFPPEAKTMEEKLRAIGMGKKVDEVVLSINRAAEDAAVKAKDIFLSAIKQMTLKDAINIVKGNDDAATQYLKTHTSAELKKQFSPIIEESLKKVNATKYWSDVMNTYNKIPMVKKMNPDLTEYVTDKAIEGLFVKIAKEEKEIRKNPLARTSNILKKVFGK
ncbi:MAG: DUF4197 domain-containing protein [Bacteroidales bacterium]|nr:DUF4197 domain-containing protein [Bacteroidales bacterium]HPD95354.1 DUF4197 domain-containing protein [Tenuifilaceae bacterium]HRX30962.1 DUF4197 domain-containing protein [Tenuifilaceae bacterium]